MKPYKYPPPLNRPTPATLIDDWYMQSSAVEQDHSKSKAAIHKLWVRHQFGLLLALMKHFDIDSKGDGAWELLAYNLALKHVPAFRLGTKPGRPPKPTNALAVWMKKSTEHRKRGRPANQERLKLLQLHIKMVADTINSHQLSGRGKYKKANEILATDFAKDRGYPVSRFVKYWVPRWQKELSEAKKLFPEIANKLLT